MSRKVFCGCGEEIDRKQTGRGFYKAEFGDSFISKDAPDYNVNKSYYMCVKCAVPLLVWIRDHGERAERLTTKNFCDDCCEPVPQTGNRAPTHVNVRRHDEHRFVGGFNRMLCQKCAKQFNDWRDTHDAKIKQEERSMAKKFKKVEKKPKRKNKIVKGLEEALYNPKPTRVVRVDRGKR